MKKLIAFLAFTVAAQGAWAEGADFSHDAEFRVRYKVDMEKDGDSDDAAATSSENAWYTRVLWGTTFRAGEQLTGNLTLVHNSVWGHTEYKVGGTGDSNLAEFDGVDNSENMLLVNEAYVNWMATDELMFRFGRGSFELANGKVVSINDYEDQRTAFEGGMAVYDSEFGKFSFFGVKFAEWSIGSVGGNTAGQGSDLETNAWGFSVDFKSLPDFFNMANIHAINISKDEIDFNQDGITGFNELEAAETRMRYGLTIGGETMNLDYSFTYAAHTGEYRFVGNGEDREGSMMDLTIGYSMPDMMKFRVELGYHTDTGDADSTDNKHEEYDPFFYNKHDNAGSMDVMRWGNLTHMWLGFKLMPMDTLTVKLAYHMFTATEADGGNTTTTSWNRTLGKDDLGSEIDLEAMKSYGDNLTIGARYSQFAPGDGFNEEDTYSQLWFQGKVTF